MLPHFPLLPKMQKQKANPSRRFTQPLKMLHIIRIPALEESALYWLDFLLPVNTTKPGNEK